MADLRIVDAPEIPIEDITGEEKLPTGGSGNYSISLDSLADYTKTKKDLADNTSVDGKVNGVRQELDAHTEDLLNPHQVTKGQIGLGNVDNTADADKPVSNSTQAAITTAVQNKADKAYVDSQLNTKADKSSVYTKSETYSRQETQGLVDNKISTALSPINSEIDYIERYTPLPYKTPKNYAVGERVTLNTGEIVENLVPNNNVDPNTDMLGWVKINSADQIFDESGLSQQEINNRASIVIDNSTDIVSLIVKDKVVVATKKYSNNHNYILRHYRYEKDSIETPNNGTIFNCESGGRFILMGDSNTINWSDWGFKDGGSYSGSDYFKPLVWGFENGYTIFKTAKNITLTSEFSYSFNPTEFKSINIDMSGLHKLNFNKVLTEAVTSILFYGNSNIDLNINVNIEGSGMGSYIDKPIYVRSLFISGFNKVDFYGKFKDIYGYGLFTDSPNIEIRKYEAIDCWGNNTIKNTLAFDAYGDGLYLSCLNAVVNNPVIINNKSISRAGIVVESLVQDKICNVVINNPKIYGYDRNIHIESMQGETILNVDINGGESNKSNTNLLIFSLNTAEINVNVNNISQETSVRPNPTIPHDFPSGHFMMSGENVSLKTNSCNFKKHISSTQLIGNSRFYSGINDTWGKDSKGLYPTWVKNISLSNIDGSLCEDKISLGSGVGVFNANEVNWGGDIELDYIDFKSQVSNVLFARNSTGYCGRLILKPNVQGVQLSDFVFDNPIDNWYAIDNQYTRLDVNDYDISNPMIENFVVYGGALFKNGGAKYRRDTPSYTLLDGNTNRIL